MTSEAEVLERLAAEVRRLSPCRHDPERFHEQKSEIAAELRWLADAVRTANGSAKQ